MLQSSSIFEINASDVTNLVNTSPQPHPNQIRSMFLGMDKKRTADGKLVRISQGAWCALEKYNQRFLKTMPKK